MNEIGQSAVIGRETELAAISRFLETGRPLHALLLTGGPGIGKTTLWEARRRGRPAARDARARLAP